VRISNASLAIEVRRPDSRLDQVRRSAQFDTVAVTAREDITEEVTGAGDYAVEIGHYSYQGMSKTAKTPRSGAGRYMVLWRKDGDAMWRLYRDIGSEVPPKKP